MSWFTTLKHQFSRCDQHPDQVSTSQLKEQALVLVSYLFTFRSPGNKIENVSVNMSSDSVSADTRKEKYFYLSSWTGIWIMVQIFGSSQPRDTYTENGE